MNDFKQWVSLNNELQYKDCTIVRYRDKYYNCPSKDSRFISKMKVFVLVGHSSLWHG